MTPPEGAPQTMCFSKNSGLGLKITTTAATQMGEIPVETVISGYKNFGGILAPERLTQKTAGQEMTIVITSVEVNTPIPEKQFDLPAPVEVLRARQAKQAK
jgi:hypothetical protein